ncbi:hypothetical protein [Roseovarius aestuariivivens]|uniref:hypothetical protein n=1 Tax=Roseovarius aestuariivivens TaxID=1888910 RepID=UPI00107FEA46|nr:hypothetical protein [Roseovarius aestuariivivens]
MKTIRTITWAACFVSGAFLSGFVSADDQVSGKIGAGKPEDIFLEITRAADGGVALSQTELRLALGGYYRLNVVCPEDVKPETGFHFEAPELLANAESEMEFYMQGLSFRAIQCDGKGSARFSFHPMRKGSYSFVARDHAEPPKETRGTIIVD